jgi:AcrR family transcriptional regulator
MASKTQRQRVDRRSKLARAERLDARDQLLSAALEAVAERGFDSCTVDEIAERAGYSKGAFYWHFASKDDLFLALIEEVVDRRWLEAIELLESASRDRDMAPAASDRFAEMIGTQRPILVAQHEYLSRALRDPGLRSRYAERLDRFRSALAKAVAARLRELGSPGSAADAQDLASAMVALVIGLSQAELIDPKFARKDLVGDVFALLYLGHRARVAAGESP